MVFWTHPIGGYEFPADATRKEIREAARAAKIDLVIDVKEK